MNRIADPRPTISSLDEAKELFMRYVLAVKRMAIHTARADKRIAEIKEQLAGQNEGLLLAAQDLKASLAAWILANLHLFADPRKIKTEFGTFGLQTVTDVCFLNEEVTLQALMDRGYTECFKAVPKPLKTPIRKRLESGEEIPGVILRSGDTVVCDEDKTLIAQAVASLEK